MNPKSASALCWFAVIVDGLGLIATAHSAQFMFSAFAAILSLGPALFARKRAQLFGVAVLMVSLALAVGGYSNHTQDPYRKRVKATAVSVSASSPDAGGAVGGVAVQTARD